MYFFKYMKRKGKKFITPVRKGRKKTKQEVLLTPDDIRMLDMLQENLDDASNCMNNMALHRTHRIS